MKNVFDHNYIPKKLLGCFTNPGPASSNTPTTGGGGAYPEGFQIGNNSQSKVAAYGVSPAVPQASSANQAGISSNAANGLLISMTVSTVVPSSGTISASSVSPMAVVFASTGMISSVDLPIINKITAQAGMGICGLPRVSTVSTIIVTYINATAANVTATAGEAYICANLRGLASTVTLTPPVIAGLSTQEVQFTVTGVAPGELLAIQKPTEQVGIGIVGMRAVTNNTIGITFINQSTTAITPTAAEVYQYVALSSMNATNNQLLLQAVTPSMRTITGPTVTTVTISVTGMAITDQCLAVGKPTPQIDLAYLGARVSAANLLELTVLGGGNVNSQSTPIAGELVSVPFIRPQTNNPLVVQTVTLTPTVIGALTTTEISFSVSNITVSTCVWVNKPSYTSGLGVVGCRAVSTNVIGITYVNNTSVSITPPAEAYVIGNFPTPVGVGHQIQQQIQTNAQQNYQLTNELRNALTALGFISGA